MASVNFFLKRPKDKNGKLKTEPVSVYLRFNIDRAHRFDLPSGEKIIPDDWQPAKQSAKSKMKGHAEFNQVLSRVKNDLIQLYRDNKSADLRTLKEMCDNLIKFGQTSGSSEKKRLLYVMGLFLKQYEKDKDHKTVAKYKALQEKITIFNKDISISDLDANFYDKFKAFLFSCPNGRYPGMTLYYNEAQECWEMRADDQGEPIGLFDDTVYKYFINLKTVLGWATTRGFEVNQSYKQWEIINRKYEPIPLTMEELEKLETLVADPNIWDSKRKTPKRSRWPVTWGIRKAKAIENARDYFLIECRTGQRISDIKRFNPSEVDQFRWTLKPKKGNRISEKKVTVHFKGYCAPALWIFQKHQFKLPVVSEQKINDAIKEACKLAGITQELTIYRWAQNKRIKITGPKYEFISSHTGRKTFITLALQFMPHQMVMDLAGIDSYDTLKHYAGKSEDVMIEKYLTEMQEKTLMKKAN
jgi:integrase